MLDYALKNAFDYAFFIDSDIVLHPKTLLHLVSRKKDIVSNIFWTKWVPWGAPMPQVWLQDENLFYKKEWGEFYTKQEIKQKNKDFVENLKIPGIYSVGGLGACTLISRHALAQGVSFSLLDNVSFWGEDRHFCIRAKALNLDLYVDTVYPAYHIYREEYLVGVNDFIKNGFSFEMFQGFKSSRWKRCLYTWGKVLQKLKQLKKKFKSYIKTKLTLKKTNVNRNNNKIVLSMVVHNEGSRYLRKMLSHAVQYVDEVLIIDDASTDNTVAVCEEILKNVPHKIIINKNSMFANEYKLRMKQWKETVKLNPGWILNLDADEIFEDSIIEKMPFMVRNKNVDAYAFRLYDMWNETQYRDDSYWHAHDHYTPYLIRYFKSFRPHFKKTRQHCGRFPKNIWRLQHINSDIRLKHYGWADEESRINKYQRYKQLDKECRYGIKEQYESILDKNPNLVDFK